MESELIDTTSLLETFLDGLHDVEGEPPRLYVDLEGNNLSREGTLSLVNILVEPRGKVYLIDVTYLKHDAFDTVGSKGRSLRDILESTEIIKVFFDIRNDSDALYSLYRVSVQGIWDLQLFEMASRDFSRRCVNGLAKCIERDSQLDWTERQRWRRIKDAGRKLFAPELGGTYAVFDQRPLSAEVEEYCAQDVALMPHLCEVYREKLCDAWWVKIRAETNARIRLSHSPRFNGKGRHMAEGPKGWVHWAPTTAERRSRTLLSTPSRIAVTAAPIGKAAAEPSASSSDEEHGEVNGVRIGPIDLRGADAPDTSGRSGRSRAEALDSSDGSDDEIARRVAGLSFGNSDSDGESECRDLTACDSECGYCGRCPY